MTGLARLAAAVQPMLPLLGTIAAYEAGLRLQRRLGGAPWANPVLVAVVSVASALEASGASPAEYLAGVRPLTLLLGPATIALAVPLHRGLPQIRLALVPVLATIAVGLATAIGTAPGIARALHAPTFIVRALVTKSVTSAVAIAVAPQIGSDPSLVAGFAVLTGIAGAAMCTTVLDRAGVHDERARGLATGTAAHGIGTARLLAVSPVAGAFSSLAMGLAGLLGGVVLPICFGVGAR